LIQIRAKLQPHWLLPVSSPVTMWRCVPRTPMNGWFFISGIPKGAMLSHENIQTSLYNVSHYERSTNKDCALCFLPLNHVFGQIHITHSMVFCGGGLVLLPAFDLEKVLDAIQRYKVTIFYAVPTVYIRMLELDELNTKIQSVRYCFSAAASMASEVVREWKARTGLDIHES
jgi:long-chain acyl-CoA synthetase